MSEVLSVRLPNSLAERLRVRAGRSAESISGLAQRLMDEGLRMESHPGIVFRPGPSGRRAGLARGPDVAEVVELILRLESSGDARLAEASEWLGVSEAQVRAALAYYAEFGDEIDARIQDNVTAAAEARASYETQQRLLG